MKHFIMIGAVLLLIFAACKKDNKAPLSTLSGRYVEVSPWPKLTALNFVNESTVVKSENGVVLLLDTFHYTLSPGYITLTQKGTSSKLEFSITDDSSFTIENLYPSIPENPKTYMEFKKQ